MCFAHNDGTYYAFPKVKTMKAIKILIAKNMDGRDRNFLPFPSEGKKFKQKIEQPMSYSELCSDTSTLVELILGELPKVSIIIRIEAPSIYS